MKIDLILLEASRKPAEVLELGEAAFDPVALFVKGFVVLSFRFTIGSGRDYRLGSTRFDVLHDGIGIIAFIGQHRFGFALAQQRQRLRTVGHLPGGHEKVQGLAQLVTQQVNFCGQPSSRTPQSRVRTPFFLPVAASWCARTMVESIIRY